MILGIIIDSKKNLYYKMLKATHGLKTYATTPVNSLHLDCFNGIRVSSKDWRFAVVPQASPRRLIDA